MSFTGAYFYRILFRGNLIDDTDDPDFGEIDTLASYANDELDKIAPNRNPDLRLDYLGITGEVEFIYTFRITFQDRDSDVEDYLDDIQESIEGQLPVVIYEREPLGIAQDQT